MRYLLLFAIPMITLAGEYDFTVEIPPGKFQCFFQPVDLSKHKTLEVDYQVIDGGDLNINFMVLLGANMIIQDKMKVDGSHRIDLQNPGDYQLCFDNSFSFQTRKIFHAMVDGIYQPTFVFGSYTGKVVFFEIFLFDAQGNLDETDLADLSQKDEQLKEKIQELGVTIADFHASSNRIKTQLNKVEYHQALLRAHEARDRSVMNANFDRVTFWSVVHTLVLLTVAGIQVYMIRSLFEDNSKMGQLLRKGVRQD